MSELFRSCWFYILLFLLLLFAGLDLFLGSARIPSFDIVRTLFVSPPSEAVHQIVFAFRLPKLCTALLVGIALPVSGLLMQTLFRNPLADPFVLGISSGATLGAALAIILGGAVVLNSVLSVAGAAIVGALVMLIVMLLATLRLRAPNTILVLGVMLSAAVYGFVSILQYSSDERLLKYFVLWTMGSVSNVSGASLWVLFLAILLGVILTLLAIRPLNLLQLGVEQASYLGLSSRSVYVVLFLATALLSGTTTAFCGSIGFVGIAVPQIARRLFHTSNLASLLIATSLVGMVALLFVDIVAQLFASVQMLPLNAFAALLSFPVILQLLLARHKYNGSQN
ncbi:MAG: FecCD family ABC transporter permease [Bacteroides sp.]